MDTLRLLAHAIALARHRNFARAAESLGVTQPSLTRGIAALEASVGATLFDRTRKGVVPTVFGRVLLERGPSLLSGDAELRREIQLLAGLETGSLAIAAGPLPAEVSVAKAVARVSMAHPRLRISFAVADPDQVAQDVLASRIDVGIASTIGLEAHGDLVAEVFAPLRVYLACRPGHPLTKMMRPTLERALEFPLATTRLRGAQAAIVSSARAETPPDAAAAALASFVPQILVHSLALARLIALDSDALCVGTEGLLAEDVASGRLVKLDIHVPAMRTTHGAIYLRGRTLAPAARLFIETLRAVEQELWRAEEVDTTLLTSTRKRRRDAA